MNFTERQLLLLQCLKTQGVIKTREARITRTMTSLKLLARYGLVTFTTEGFCLTVKGADATKELA